MTEKHALYVQAVGLQIPTIKTVPLWSLGIDVDPWVFTSGQPGIDTAGKYSSDAGDQTWQALENLRAIIEEAGLAFSDTGKLVVYLRDREMWPGAEARLIDYLRAHFGEQEFPAITAAAAPLTVPTLHVEIEAIACRDRKPFWKSEYPVAVGEASACVDMSGLVFVGAQVADADLRQSPLEVELDSAMERLDGALAAAGVGLDELVRLTIYVGEVSRHAEARTALDTWMAKHLRGTERPTISMLFAESFRGANVECEAVAARGVEIARFYDPERGGEYPSAVKAGSLVYISQQDGRDESGALPADIRGQTLAALEKAERALASAGAAFGDIVHVLIWHGEPASYEPLNEIRVPYYRVKFTDGKYPASTAVPAPLPDSELIRFEAVAWRP